MTDTTNEDQNDNRPLSDAEFKKYACVAGAIIASPVVLMGIFAYFGAKRGAYKGAAKMLDNLKLEVNLATDEGLLSLAQMTADPFPR